MRGSMHPPFKFLRMFLVHLLPETASRENDDNNLEMMYMYKDIQPNFIFAAVKFNLSAAVKITLRTC